MRKSSFRPLEVIRGTSYGKIKIVRFCENLAIFIFVSNYFCDKKLQLPLALAGGRRNKNQCQFNRKYFRLD